MVSTLYDEERVSERISAYGTEVVLRRCLNEVVPNCHLIIMDLIINNHPLYIYLEAVHVP